MRAPHAHPLFRRFDFLRAWFCFDVAPRQSRARQHRCDGGQPRKSKKGIWQSTAGAITLYAALTIHMGLGFWTTLQATAFSLERMEAMQLALSLVLGICRAPRLGEEEAFKTGSPLISSNVAQRLDETRSGLRSCRVTLDSQQEPLQSSCDDRNGEQAAKESEQLPVRIA
jgi:hypothetical protein